MPLNRSLGLWVAVSLLAVGCTVGPAPSSAAPSASPTPSLASPSPTVTMVGDLALSTTPAPAVDRLELPAVEPKVAGLEGPLGPDLDTYLGQKLNWSGCEQDTECTRVLAPLDYADPGQGSVTLSLRRKPATATPKLGTLFINPGGPGASGMDLISSFPSTGLEAYDIVGWDPRGTGQSTPIRCLSDAETDAFNELDLSPDDPSERAVLLAGVEKFNKGCWQRNGRLLEHVGTADTVRDLDLLRRLLNDPKLNFVGYSYGTQIGAYYAELFPENTGRLVLDAAVNITADESIPQAEGFDLALRHYATWCAKQSCSLGSTEAAVIATITGLWDRLDAAPLTVTDGGRLTQSLAVTGVAAMLYGGSQAWPSIAFLVQSAINGDGRGLLAAADILNGRSEDGSYGPMIYAFPAIGCRDSTDDGVLDADADWVADQKKAPIFGKYFGPSYTCALWPVRPDVQLHPTGAGAAPLLVIGGLGDNATPYRYAEWMAKQLKSATLITYTGEGHGSFGGKSTCVDDAVIAYLTQGTVPAVGLRCS